MGDVVNLKNKRKAQNPSSAKLTQALVKKAEYDPEGSSWQVIWDTEITGFGLRLQPPSSRSPDGIKAYIVSYRNEAGKKRYITVGKADQIPLRKARKIARAKLAEVWQGEDPMQKRREKRDAKPETDFGALARQFVDDYAKAKRKSWETDERRLFPTDEEAPIYRLHGLVPAEAGREGFEDALARLHSEIATTTPVEADRVAQTISRVMNWAAKRRLVSGAFYNLIDFIDLNGWERREDYIRAKELPKLRHALALESKKWRCAVWLTLLTGSRLKSEVLQLRWEDVHLEIGEFTFRDTKNGTDHTLPITPAIRAIFEAVPRSKHTPEYVFPSRIHGQPVQDSRKPFARIRKRARFVDKITPHALRHTASTYMRNDLHLPDGMNRAVLNHSSTGITDNYAHVSIEGLRDALVKLETFILAEAKVSDFAECLAKKKPKKRN